VRIVGHYVPRTET
jgi:hypothetical protein